MKKMITTVFLSACTLLAFAENKTATIQVKASIYCDHCEECESCGKRLEEAIYTEKGIKRVELNEATKTVSVVYNSGKTSADKIRAAIANVGFDADGVKGNPEAYAQWDECCKK